MTEARVIALHESLLYAASKVKITAALRMIADEGAERPLIVVLPTVSEDVPAGSSLDSFVSLVSSNGEGAAEDVEQMQSSTEDGATREGAARRLFVAHLSRKHPSLSLRLAHLPLTQIIETGSTAVDGSDIVDEADRWTRGSAATAEVTALLSEQRIIVTSASPTRVNDALLSQPGSWSRRCGQLELDAALVAGVTKSSQVTILVGTAEHMLYDIMPPSLAGPGLAHVVTELRLAEALQICSAAVPSPFNPQAVELSAWFKQTFIVQFVPSVIPESTAADEFLAGMRTVVAGTASDQLSITAGVQPQVKAISARQNVSLVCVESIHMWREAGYLAQVFRVFEQLGHSIDLVSTSQTNITVSLESDITTEQLSELRTKLLALPGKSHHKSGTCGATVDVITGCTSLSLVGRQIRRTLGMIERTLRLFQEREVHLISQAASDLNFTLVISQQDQALVTKTLVAGVIVAGQGAASAESLREDRFGEDVTETPKSVAPDMAGGLSQSWWCQKKDELKAIVAECSPAYVYYEGEVASSVDNLQAMTAIDDLFFAIKANPNRDILRYLHSRGVNFECVSPGEVRLILELFPDIDRKRILFTPNFAPKTEYEFGFKEGINVTVDNIYPLAHWPEVFRGKEIKLRVDPGQGKGHHAHVRTAGKMSKFGIVTDDLPKAAELAAAMDCTVVGLHCHVGSGILEPQIWSETAQLLGSFKTIFPQLEVVDVGGGLGVVENVDTQHALELERVNERLLSIKEKLPGIKLWMEPGRYFVARAGVLLATVTQLKTKQGVEYVGIDTGFNSLIRPALYGSHHHIFNLDRLYAASLMTAEIVGQICETGDVLGHQREISAETAEGDTILIATAGAYGHSMGMHYNLREPAKEHYIK